MPSRPSQPQVAQRTCHLHFSQAVADRAYIIEKGQIRFGGLMAELAADASLREQYLSV